MPSVEARLQDDLGAVTRAGHKVSSGGIYLLRAQLRWAGLHAGRQQSQGNAVNAVAGAVKMRREAIECHEKLEAS